MKIENGKITMSESEFYMDICRAYNAGKKNIQDMYTAVKNGDPDGNSVFVSSHEYFKSEFPDHSSSKD